MAEPQFPQDDAPMSDAERHEMEMAQTLRAALETIQSLRESLAASKAREQTEGLRADRLERAAVVALMESGQLRAQLEHVRAERDALQETLRRRSA